MPIIPGGAEDPAERIERLIEHQAPEIRAAFLAAVAQIQNRNTIEAIVEMLESGNTQQLFAAVQPAAEIFATSYGTAVTEAGISTASFLSSEALSDPIAFDRARFNVVQVIQNEQQRLIRIFTQEQNQVIRNALQDGFNRGLNPREQARNIRSTVGLAPVHEQWIANYRSQLEGRLDGLPSRAVLRRQLRDRRFDRSVERALRDGRPLEADRINRMVERYRERMVAFHAEIVGRTEALSAVHQGSRATYEQAIEAGQFTAEELERRWWTARDERVRHSHRLLHDTTRGFNEPWQALGGSLMFPGDPRGPLSETVQCRCSVTIRLRPPS